MEHFLAKFWAKLLMSVLATFGSGREAFAFDFNLGCGFPYVYFKKTSDDGTVSASVPVGVEVNGSYFFAQRMAVLASFEINLESQKKTMVFMGGEGSLAFYLSGGAKKTEVSGLFSASSSPRLNTYLFLGAGGRAYNFNAFDSGSSSKIVRRALNNQLRGSFIGVIAGIATSFALANDLHLVLKGKVVKGLADEVTPSITLMGGSVGIEALL